MAVAHVDMNDNVLHSLLALLEDVEPYASVFHSVVDGIMDRL